MNVAIPHWQGRVSPVFDVARQVLLVAVGPTGERTSRDVALPCDDPQERATFLAGTGAEVLICGAISRPLEMALAAAGIRVIPQTCGAVSDVLDAFFTGELTGGAFRMPGCCGRRRRRQGRRGDARG